MTLIFLQYTKHFEERWQPNKYVGMYGHKNTRHISQNIFEESHKQVLNVFI